MIAGLPPGYRCVALTLPPGAHRRVMKPSADLSLLGMARLVGEFLDRLGLADVTLVGNDSGGAITQMLISGGAPRVERVVPASCDGFGNFPPGLTGRTLALAPKLPPALFGLVIQQMRVRPLRPLPNAFGWLTKRGDAAAAWNQSSPSAASAATRSACSAPSSPARTCCAAPPKDSPASASPHSSSGRKGDRVIGSNSCPASTRANAPAAATPGCSRTPSAAAPTAATCAGSRTAASSTSQAPSANRPATRRATWPASRVLPPPPRPGHRHQSALL